MIEKTTAFKVGEQFFPCIKDAQEHELQELLTSVDSPLTAAVKIMEHKDEVINILTMTPQSHPKARKANGATRRPRKTKTEPTPEV